MKRLNDRSTRHGAQYSVTRLSLLPSRLAATTATMASNSNQMTLRIGADASQRPAAAVVSAASVSSGRGTPAWRACGTTLRRSSVSSCVLRALRSK